MPGELHGVGLSVVDALSEVAISMSFLLFLCDLYVFVNATSVAWLIAALRIL